MEKSFSGARRVVHIYQRSKNGYLLFYTASDYLVFFSIACNAARNRGMRVLGICPMFDHVHMVVAAERREDVRMFVRDVFSQYAKAFNASIGASGPVFCKHFGCAVKKGDKAIRTTLSYLYNNPGEKGLCTKAEEFRWTFLAYAASTHPFSEPLIKKKCSRRLVRAMKGINLLRTSSLPLVYPLLKKEFSGLCAKEKQQLVDFIITSYNCIDYETLLSLYGNSYNQACLAFASNQGAEYDIHEEYDPTSHRAFMEIPRRLSDMGHKDIKSILKLPPESRFEILLSLFHVSKATMKQLCKYLRIEIPQQIKR
ncbi:MAG: transposase [Bacteroidales bacterium]|nr:transposase [Bacteroidales bacterium]